MAKLRKNPELTRGIFQIAHPNKSTLQDRHQILQTPRIMQYSLSVPLAIPDLVPSHRLST